MSADSRKGLAQDTLFTGEDEKFAFHRAISRLCEMQSAAYIEARERAPSEGGGAAGEAEERAARDLAVRGAGWQQSM